MRQKPDKGKQMHRELGNFKELHKHVSKRERKYRQKKKSDSLKY